LITKHAKSKFGQENNMTHSTFDKTQINIRHSRRQLFARVSYNVQCSRYKLTCYCFVRHIWL